VWQAETPAPTPAVWLTADGKAVRVVTQDGQLRAWDAATGEPLGEGEQLAARGRLRYSADLSRAAGWEKGEQALSLFDAKTGAKLATTVEHVGRLTWPVMSADGKRAASLGKIDRVARVWDTATGKQVFACDGHIGTPTAAAFSPDGTRLATVADDGWVKLWDTATGKETLTLRCPTTRLWAVGFSPSGGKLVVTDADGVAHIRDAGSGR